MNFARSGGPGGQNVNKGQLPACLGSINAICDLLFFCNPYYFYVVCFLLRLIFLFTVNTKVDMRFNVRNADWLSERVKERIMQMVTYYCYFWSYPFFRFSILVQGHVLQEENWNRSA